MSWTSASRALFFRGICKFPPIEDKEVSAAQIRDELNASIKRFQKKFTVEDIVSEIDVWFKVVNADSDQENIDKEEDSSLSSESFKHEADESEEGERQELTGRAARAYKRRRHPEADEEHDSSAESDQDDTQDEKVAESEPQENSRSRRASRAARPSMKRNLLSPKRRSRQTPAKVKQEDAVPSQKPAQKASASVNVNCRKSRSQKSNYETDRGASPHQQVSDQEDESDTTPNSRKQSKVKSEGTGPSTQPSSPKAKRASRRKVDESNAGASKLQEDESEAPKRPRVRRSGVVTQQENRKPSLAAAIKANSSRGRNTMKRQRKN